MAFRTCKCAILYLVFFTTAPFLSVVLASDSNAATNCNNSSNGIISDDVRATSDYGKLHNLYDDLLRPDRYSPLIRPVYNQTHTVRVYLRLKIFELISIDDVNQRMVTNCHVELRWKDEMMKWDGQANGGIYTMNPKVGDVWTPEPLMVNSVSKKEVLGRESGTRPTVHWNGNVRWGFDEILTTSCNLNMDKYPFDVQTCSVEITTASDVIQEVEFMTPDSTVNMENFAYNYGWDMVETQTNASRTAVGDAAIPWAKFTLTFRRRYILYVINDVLPTVYLAFLNCFVFLVPAQSGEKISFGISVLLALAVFLSYNSTKLPLASDGIPAVTKYLGALFANAIVAVIITIIDARLNHYLHQHQLENATTQTETTSGETTNHPYINPTTTTTATTATTIAAANQNSKTTTTMKDPTSLNNSRVSVKTRFMSILPALLQYTDRAGFVLIMGNWVTLTGYFLAYVSG